MNQRVHVAWASVSLAMVGVGFALGSQGGSEPDLRSPRAALAPGAPVSHLASSPPVSLAPAQATQSSRRDSSAPESDPESPKTLASPAPPARLAPRPAEIARRDPQPRVRAPLDPDAEALVRLLFRLRLRGEESEPLPGGRSLPQIRFVCETLSGMLGPLGEQDRGRLLVALTAYVPGHTEWSGLDHTPPGVVEASRWAYEEHPHARTLYAHVMALAASKPESLDASWIEALARQHPSIDELQRLLAKVAPLRAAEVFAVGGLSLDERELLVGIHAQTDPARAGALARELLIETKDPEYLLSALEHDPQGTAEFLAERKDDPLWAGLYAIAEIHSAYDEDLLKVRKVIGERWRLLSPEHMVDALELLNSETWTPLEDEILRHVLANGGEATRDSFLYLSPPEVRWQFEVELSLSETEDADEANLLAVLHYLEFLSEKPFLAKPALEVLYRLTPSIEPALAVQLAWGFQEKGDSQTAKAVLERAPGGKIRSMALAHLEASLSLQELQAQDEFQALVGEGE